ncbi:peptidase S8/S53 domain-containing protein [Podospora conica]|nr:peptidase S8/S53 domain-containing protein [Schizothecium conicum]
MQLNAPWGLGRISHRTLSHSDYYWDSTAGQRVRVYIVDSGIQTSHTEFEGRAIWGANFVANSPDVDENGHGTHVAGTVGGKTFGVARKATLVAVKVLKADGSGSYSNIIKGIEWVVSNATAQGAVKRSVINMSLGGALSTALNSAVKQATDAGITFVVAAGNSNVDAIGVSPASAPSAITVGATDGTDQRAWFSNFGPSVDLFAPGVAILSSVVGSSNTGTAYYTGTSMGK